LRITRNQLIDLAILVGTDFNKGIRGIGPKTALKLIKKYGSLESLPEEYRTQLPTNLEELRSIFLKPEVTDEYEVKFAGLDEDGLRSFLCGERGFSPKRVDLAITRMKEFYSRARSSLSSWASSGRGN
jgi:flap endonuclease-1